MTRPVDWGAEERKLQPVFDDIHEGRMKTAQAAVDRWLKKHPKSQVALVARMMLADATRQGRAAVLKAYEDVQTTAPLSPRSIWRVSTVLRSIRCPEMVLDLFQALAEERPGVPDLADQVFFEAAAMGKTDLMASTSRKTFNLQKIPARARLAAYSAWADATPSPTDAEPFPRAPEKALLPAQLLIRTTGAEVPTAETLWLRLQVALGAGDGAEAWRLVKEEGRKGALSRRWFGMAAARELAIRNDSPTAEEVWADEFAAMEELLATDGEAQHNYAFYRYLMEAAKDDERLQKAAALFRDLVVKIGEKERAPILAVLELDLKAPMPEAEWEATVRDYLARWGGKWTAQSDLTGVVGTHAAVLKGIMKEAASQPHSDERSFVARAVAELYLLSVDPPTPSMDEVRSLWDLYSAGLAYGKNLTTTDPQPADPVGMAAVSMLGRLWQANPSDQAPLIHAAECLEAMVAASHSCYHARFTLCRVYRLLGAPALYAPHLKQLSLSEVQLDNLLHVVSERGSLEAHAAGITLWEELEGRATEMYGRSVTDLPNYIKQALQHETYSKVHGMRALIRALERSIAQRVLEIEELSLALASGGPILDSTVESLSAAMRDEAPFVDNRNFELMAEGFVEGSAPQPTMDEATVRALAAALLGVTAYLSGSDDAPTLPDRSGLSATDKAFVDGVEALLAAAKVATPASPPSPTPAPVPAVTGMYDAPIAAILAAPTTWARVDAYASLARLVGAARAVEKRVTELAGPAKKGKKRPVGLVQLGVGLRTAREAVPKRLAEVNALMDRDVSWPTGGLVDAEISHELGNKVREARAGVRAGLSRFIK
ncbi:hypothetical protein CcaverHIS002_0509510 [Cutaneotrichosporon cavernicola]|uniref:Uncharacterized protein n=1 Tax=Cutaneotrichosporon cavernicola TaxID=279322 RepID=A0AA48L7E9_9TREE|nr:uncharacterized protein CcaverHIS019_0510070 [Cutaneotrichosporon cavernicola]BEI85550.1 hypothetical protein CcaverHIS002_0509510 [Cutaneotrichosporon cavernicola]BEI93379.1 hypothetical protein CcaverHIS019_0510070 [Cutaneotrichosporon cavernicola]BEJ01157.1 hypothetical protein CcaverHIS631_0510140 [Cutaneotrichosporon cavernicola]BEJ08925.1 hypothetical protein CcaverHIS641_0510190 [Cutaneotrichosporon cavernicola]